MNPPVCEREAETSAAARSGILDQAISRHAENCPACSDILLVTGLFHQTMSLAEHEPSTLPPPDLIWRQARLEARQEVLRLAMRPIRLMKIVALIAFACSPWLRLMIPIGREVFIAGTRTLDSALVLLSNISLSTSTEATILLGLSGMVLLLGLSSWFMLREQ